MSLRVTTLNILPQCNFCIEVSHYDFMTKSGSWAYGCELHWREHRRYEGLGLGEGQLLLNPKEVRRLYNRIIFKEVVSYEEAFNPPRDIED